MTDQDLVTNDALIEVEGLSTRRGNFELNIPKWSMPRGSVVGVIGRNGAGKTTLLRALAGLDPIDKGKITVLGHDPIKHPVETLSRVGFANDDMPIFALKIKDLLHFVSGYYPTWDKDFVNELIERFELDVEKKTGDLSKGHATRIRLVLAMAFRPQVLILDEPATGLDYVARRRLLETILEAVKDENRSVIISSHQIADVERIADRLLMIEGGRVIQDGGSDELIGDERTLEEAYLEWSGAA